MRGQNCYKKSFIIVSFLPKLITTLVVEGLSSKYTIPFQLLFTEFDRTTILCSKENCTVLQNMQLETPKRVNCFRRAVCEGCVPYDSIVLCIAKSACQKSQCADEQGLFFSFFHERTSANCTFFFNLVELFLCLLWLLEMRLNIADFVCDNYLA